VLLRSSDILEIYLHPQMLWLQQLHRPAWRLTTQQVAEQYIEIAQPADSNASLWQGALAKLGEILQQPRWQFADTRITLSHHFVRFALIPAAPSLHSAQEQNAYLAHCFQQAFGAASQHWDLRMQPGHKQASLASGVERHLLSAMAEIWHKRDARLQHQLRHVQPLLVNALNQIRTRHKPEPALWLLLIETGRISLLLWQNAAWQTVQNEAAPASAIESILDRASILAGDLAQDWPVLLYYANPQVARVRLQRPHKVFAQPALAAQPVLAKVRA
jgi:hypothetical protein